MAFYRDKQYNNCIQKVKVEFGTLLGEEKEEDVYVVLKELPTLETMQLKEAHEEGQLALLTFFKNVLPNIIVEHNLYETENKKMSNKDVVELIFEKLDVATKVITEFSEQLFTSRKNKTEEK